MQDGLGSSNRFIREPSVFAVPNLWRSSSVGLGLVGLGLFCRMILRILDMYCVPTVAVRKDNDRRATIGVDPPEAIFCSYM